MSRPNRALAVCAIVGLLVVRLAVAATLSPSLSTPLGISSTIKNTTVPVFATIKPMLTSYTPQPCVKPGQALTLKGNKLAPPNGRRLVMDTGQGLFTLVVGSWTNTQLHSQLPASFSHQATVKIGIRSSTAWVGQPLSVAICAPPVLSPPVLGTTMLSPLVPPNAGSDTSAPAAAPAATLAVPEAPETPGNPEDTETPTPSSPGFLPPADGGSLLGAALPPVPEGLNLVAQEEGDSTFTPHVLVAVTASMADAQRLQRIMMQDYQARVVRRRKLGALGMVISAFRLPDQAVVAETLDSVRQQYADLWIDANHYFRPLADAGNRAALYRAIGHTTGARCGRGLRVGLLDGPVALTHPALKGQVIQQKVLFARGRTAAPTQHATALASLLVGNPAVAGLGGVISEAQLAVGVVMQQGEDDAVFSTSEDLLTGLNWLLQQPVQVINLSLGGPRNALLEVALQRVLSLGVGVVAAAGNGGPDAAPSYPAAQTGVLAVTAVDSDGRVARDANHGDYIDLAAPGVDAWVADVKTGGRYASGSSMAAPLVAAALAQLGGNPAQAKQLFQHAHDLGAPGKDPVSGWGLLQQPDCGNARRY